MNGFWAALWKSAKKLTDKAFKNHTYLKSYDKLSSNYVNASRRSQTERKKKEHNRTQATERAEKCLFVPGDLVPGDLDLCVKFTRKTCLVPRSDEQIRSTVPEIFHTQTKKSQRQKQSTC